MRNLKPILTLGTHFDWRETARRLELTKMTLAVKLKPNLVKLAVVAVIISVIKTMQMLFVSRCEIKSVTVTVVTASVSEPTLLG